MKELTKTMLISVAFFVFFFAFGAYNYQTYGIINNNQDFAFHWQKIHDTTYEPSYPDGYHRIFSIFGENELAFYTANLLIICIAIPLLLFFALKTSWAVIIYFAGISLPHILIYGATYPQALVFVFFIIYLMNRKNPFIFITCATLAFLIHKEGVLLFGLILIAEFIDWIINKIGKIQPQIIFPAIVTMGVEKIDTIPKAIGFFLKEISPPIYYYSKEIIYKPFWLTLAIIPVIMINFDPRIIGVTEIALLFVATPKIAELKNKKWAILFLIGWLIFFLTEFCIGTQNIIKYN